MIGRVHRSIARCASLGLLLLMACGPKQSMIAYESATAGQENEAAPAAAMMSAAPYESAGGEAEIARSPAKRADARTAEIASDTAKTASDALPARGPLLIYTAHFQLSVFEVEKSQSEAKALAAALGGFVAKQTQESITIRVPAPRFEDAVTKIEHMGKVLSRQLQALDVGEEYRDLGLRLKTLEAMRSRLEELLARATTVKEALEVEQQLGRVLQEIELLKGKLRALEDRIAYSTLTLSFQPVAQPQLDQSRTFRLPFPWLEELGVHNLLEVSR